MTTEKNQKTRIMIVEDSMPVQVILNKVFSRIPNVEIVATVGSAEKAAKMVDQLRPNLISLDMKLEGGTGLDFLKLSNFREYSRSTGARCILVTDYSLHDRNFVFEAISLGATSYIRKPQGSDLARFTTEITDIITAFFRKADPSLRAVEPVIEASHSIDLNAYNLIAVGSSTGGTEIVRDIIGGLPRNCPPIVVAQHMPEQYTSVFASRIQAQTQRPTIEVKGPVQLHNNHAYIAAGSLDMIIEIRGPNLFATTRTDSKETRFKPSVAALFDSIQKIGLSNKSVAIMLTGMGHDGAQEMLKLKQGGALTIGQSKESCVVYGMPRAAAELGALFWSASPDKIIANLSHGTKK